MAIVYQYIIFCAYIGITVYALGTYIKDVKDSSTLPHPFTWLVWSITQWSMTIIEYQSGAGIVAYGFALGSIMVLVIFVIGYHAGSRDVTLWESYLLSALLHTIIVWWLVSDILLSAILLTIIDIGAYAPTYAKTYKNPWTEDPYAWLLITVSTVFAMLALATWSVVTLLYPMGLVIVNALLAILIVVRRRYVPRPASYRH